MNFKALAISAAMAFGVMTGAASAATCDTSCDVTGGDGQLLSDVVQFDITKIAAGAFEFTATFENDTGFDSAEFITTVLQFVPTRQGFIQNLVATVAGFSYNITDANGMGMDLTGNDNIVNVAVPLGTVDFTLAGTAVASGQNLPGILVTVNPVPVPAGILLMGTALAGFGVASRRKKKANA